MPIYALGDLVPHIHPDAFVYPDAVVIGAVTTAPPSCPTAPPLKPAPVSAVRLWYPRTPSFRPVTSRWAFPPGPRPASDIRAWVIAAVSLCRDMAQRYRADLHRIR